MPADFSSVMLKGLNEMDIANWFSQAFARIRRNSYIKTDTALSDLV